jgi:hypothetical protein
MVCRKSKRAGRQGQKWVTTSLSERAHSLTVTVTALELDAGNPSLTGCEDFDVTNNKDSSVHENVDVTKMSTPPASSVDDRDTDDELESEDARVDASTTTAQQVQMHLGTNDAHDGNTDDDDTNPGNEPKIKVTPVDCATLDVLKLCHDAGVSLEFYDIPFALLCKHSSKNEVDITKLPKRDTFLKSLRVWISSPIPIVSQVGNLQVPHFDMLPQIRDLLGSFVFNDLSNLCVNLDPEQRYQAFVHSIGFGCNTHGMFGATLDDPMHFNESGLFDGVTKAFCGCFAEEELKKFERSTRSLHRNSRSSVRSECPKSRISKGFTSCTLKMANETVGCRTDDANEEDFPRTNKSCRALFKHLKRHGLGFVLDLELDEIQMEHLLIVSWCNDDIRCIK